MKTLRTAAVLTVVVFALAAAAPSQSPQKRPGLSAAEQAKLLSQRLPSGAVTGSFGSFGSLLFAVLDVAIHTDDKAIGDTQLNSPFPEYYKPTLRELLDTIAAQTASSWSYDPARDFWVFAKPAAPKPYALTLAPKWTAEERGVSTTYRPPAYPVGMDVYYYGSYSADDPKQEAALWEKIRDGWAVGFASRLKRGVTVGEMKKVSVAGAQALYFETPTPRPGVRWRQWAFVKDGRAFVVVSALPDEDKALLAEVESMVKSLRVTP